MVVRESCERETPVGLVRACQLVHRRATAVVVLQAEAGRGERGGGRGREGRDYGRAASCRNTAAGRLPSRARFLSLSLAAFLLPNFSFFLSFFFFALLTYPIPRPVIIWSANHLPCLAITVDLLSVSPSGHEQIGQNLAGRSPPVERP